MADYVTKSFRITDKSRLFALSFFSPYSEKPEKVSIENLPLQSAALCLYSAMLLTQTHENLPYIHNYFLGIKDSNFKCEQRVRQIRSKIYRENPTWTQQQIDEKAEEQLSFDVRNALAHGSFKISFDKNSLPVFELSTTYNREFSNMPISISYESLFHATQERRLSLLSEIPTKEILKNQLDTYSVDPKVLKEFVLPQMLLHMATFFYNRNYSVPKEAEEYIRDPVYFQCLRLITLSSFFAYVQNDAHAVLSTNSQEFKKFSVIRNSLMHEMMELYGTGVKIKNGKSKYRGVTREEYDTNVLVYEAEILLTKVELAKVEKQINFDSIPEEEKESVQKILTLSGLTPENAEETKIYLQSVLRQQTEEYNKYTMGKILMAIKWSEEHPDALDEDLEVEEKNDPDGEGK